MSAELTPDERELVGRLLEAVPGMTGAELVQAYIAAELRAHAAERGAATSDDFADLRDDAERAEPTHERKRLRDLLAALDASRAELAAARESADFYKDCLAASEKTGRFLFDERNAARGEVSRLHDSEAAAVRRAEVAEARLEVGAAFRALSRASRDVKSGDPAAPGRKAAAHMRLDAAEARVLALGATVDEEVSRG